jgi:hypothetical protein
MSCCAIETAGLKRRIAVGSPDGAVIAEVFSCCTARKGTSIAPVDA